VEYSGYRGFRPPVTRRSHPAAATVRRELLSAGNPAHSWHHDQVRTPFLTQRLSRRAVLRVAGSAALGASALALTTGCADSGQADTPAEIDALTAQAERARRDATNATAAIALLPDRAGALGVVAAERSAHADALDAEIARVATVTPSSTTSSTPPVTAPPTLDQLRADLADAQKDAARLARTQSGYRAGLLGSISAACAAQQAVLLA
jgi:hypothetical protein